MTIKEAEAFYNEDQKQYLLVNRPGFAEWYSQNYENNNSLAIENLQELVDKVIAWYVFRYPNRLLDESILDYHFTDIEDISSKMDLKQLLYRLGTSELSIFECKYRTDSLYGHNNKIYCTMNVSKGKRRISEFSITENGNLSYNTQKALGLPFQSIEEFYEENREDYDMTNVIKCIDKHNNDLVLRNHIIDAIRQGLLYYVHTNPEYGKYRMDKFTSDITSYYEDIDLENKKYVIEDEKTTSKGLIKRLRGEKK